MDTPPRLAAFFAKGNTICNVFQISTYDIEDFTRVVIFYLSYDPLKWDFIAFSMNMISIKYVLLTRTLPMMLCARAKCYYTRDHTIFMP